MSFIAEFLHSSNHRLETLLNSIKPWQGKEQTSTPLHPHPAAPVSALWQFICQTAFKAGDGFRVAIVTDSDLVQRVVVYEQDLWDQAFDVVAPVKVLTTYLRRAKMFTREIPIFVVECRGAHLDEIEEWRTPLATDRSRSYRPDEDEQSTSQKSLWDWTNGFEVQVGREKTYYGGLREDIGGKIQEQIACATAIGTKIRFFKKGTEFPLMAWGDVLDLKDELDLIIVEGKLYDVREDGYDFAMEWAQL
jgi:hypothetical protein